MIAESLHVPNDPRIGPRKCQKKLSGTSVFRLLTFVFSISILKKQEQFLLFRIEFTRHIRRELLQANDRGPTELIYLFLLYGND